MGKLIRDRLLGMEWKWLPEAKEYARKVRDEDEHSDLLQQKLLEEAGEVITARTAEALTLELADLLEVMRAISSITGITWESVEHARLVKRNERGGFEQGVVWDV